MGLPPALTPIGVLLNQEIIKRERTKLGWKSTRTNFGRVWKSTPNSMRTLYRLCTFSAMTVPY